MKLVAQKNRLQNYNEASKLEDSKAGDAIVMDEDGDGVCTSSWGTQISRRHPIPSSLAWDAS